MDNEQVPALNLSDVLSGFNVERPEPLRHGDWVEKFKHTPEKYHLLNQEDITLEKLNRSLLTAERILVPVLSDYISNVLVEPSDSPTPWVESEKGQFLFLRVERQLGYLEIIPVQVAVTHEENADGFLTPSDNYWSVKVNARFYSGAKLEDLQTDKKQVPVKFNNRKEVLNIQKINGTVTITITQ